MTRKKLIKFAMSLLYGRNEAVEYAWRINRMMKDDPKITYKMACDVLLEYDHYDVEVLNRKKGRS